MWISRQSRLTINFFAPSVGKWFNFYLKNAETTFFAQDLYLGKNDRFDLLGWLNECWDPFLIVITLMWTSRQ